MTALALVLLGLLLIGVGNGVWWWRHWVDERREHTRTWTALHELLQIAGDEQRLLTRHLSLLNNATPSDFARLLEDRSIAPEDLGWLRKIAVDPPREGHRAADLVERLEAWMVQEQRVTGVAPEHRRAQRRTDGV